MIIILSTVPVSLNFKLKDMLMLAKQLYKGENLKQNSKTKNQPCVYFEIRIWFLEADELYTYLDNKLALTETVGQETYECLLRFLQ